MILHRIVPPVILLLVWNVFVLLISFILCSVHLLFPAQVCPSCPSSPERSRGAAPAATGRSGTASCCRRWTGTGTRTVWSAPAVTAAWAGWAPPSTPGPTSSSAAGTTWGNPSTGVSGLHHAASKQIIPATTAVTIIEVKCRACSILIKLK